MQLAFVIFRVFTRDLYREMIKLQCTQSFNILPDASRNILFENWNTLGSLFKLKNLSDFLKASSELTSSVTRECKCV